MPWTGRKLVPALALSLALTEAACAQEPDRTTLTLPAGTNLQVESARSVRMRPGAPVEGRLLYPVYVDGRLALPAGTLLRGTVVSLGPDPSARVSARFHGDFTPFHVAQVDLTQIQLAGGFASLQTSGAVSGVPVMHLAAPGAAPRSSFVHRAWTHLRERLRAQVSWFVDPGFGDRASQLLYHQLPWHPERLEAHTAWSLDLASPLPVVTGSSAATPSPTRDPNIWRIAALLQGDLDSSRVHPGDEVRALVVEPVIDSSLQTPVPQGSLLIGKVTSARAARSFGRNGRLRFTFQRILFPQGAEKPVQGALAGTMADSRQDLALDAEGNVTPRDQSSVIAPLLFTMLAGRALDEDGNLYVKSGVASNGFGLAGRIAGIAAGSRQFAAGIGFYAAALSLYENFLRRGRDVRFPRNTRIEIETTALRAPVLRPNAQQP